MDELKRQTLNMQIHDILFHLVDWVLPPSCPGCGLEGEIICNECESKIVRLVGKQCTFCGQAVRGSNICGDCRDRSHSYDAYRGYGLYTGVLREAILRLKYQNDVGIAESYPSISRMLYFLQIGYSIWLYPCHSVYKSTKKEDITKPVVLQNLWQFI